VATPSAPKLRRVLALLVVHAGSEVRTDQIIEELWESRPPVSAMTTLQTYVYQLRKLLKLSAGTGPNGADRAQVPALRTSPGGYVFALPSAGLDAHEFERLAERGRAQLTAGRPEQAAETLRAALRLWRGPVLSDVGVGPILQMALGRHHELISELTGIVAQQPTHEGFQGKLMLTLYRAGRRSDALRVYQRARAMLAGELGLAPSPELERLHRAVLVADTTLDAPSDPRARLRVQRTGPPSQLPADTEPIVGRSEALSQVQRLLRGAQHGVPPVVGVCGGPGSGKSAFCVHAAGTLRANYPDGQLFVELVDATGAQVEARATLGYWLRTAGVPAEHVPASLAERTSLFRSWTANRRVLVVLDDAVGIDQLLPLLPTGAGCAALVACRRRLSGPQLVATVGLEPLAARDAEALLAALLGHRRIAEDPAAVAELIEICRGSPLALRTTAARLALRPHWPIRRLISRIRPDPHTLSAEELGISPSVRRTDRLMPPAVRGAFRIVAQQTWPTTAVIAARMLGVDAGHAETLLEDLVEFQLAEVARGTVGPDDTFRYQIQPLLRACATQLDQIEDALTPG
jgi:DNA-binding SARP family transcriptional activator